MGMCVLRCRPTINGSMLRRHRNPSLKVREMQQAEEDSRVSVRQQRLQRKAHAQSVRRQAESLEERQERLQNDARAQASKRMSESVQERQERLQSVSHRHKR